MILNLVNEITRKTNLFVSYSFVFFSYLAQQIWDIGHDKKNPSDFALAIDESSIGSLDFTDDFIFDIWAAIDDIKAGRVQEQDFIVERL